MIEIAPLVLAFGLGTAGAAIFYGGLWITVRYAAAHQSSALLFTTSLIVRTAALFGVLYLSSLCGEWYHVMTALAALMLGRLVITRIVRRSDG